MIQPLWRTVWRFLIKLKIELPYDPAIPLLGIYPEKTIIQKESLGFPGGAVVENLPAYAGDTGSSPGWEDPTCCRAAGTVSYNY